MLGLTGSKLFAKVISWRQKSPIADQELNASSMVFCFYIDNVAWINDALLFG